MRRQAEDVTFDGRWTFKSDDLREIPFSVKDQMGKWLMEVEGVSKRLKPADHDPSAPMLDDLERLRASQPLHQLLAHYGQLAQPDRSVWQDRLMVMSGLDARELTKLHGLLIAMDWIELRTGHVGAGSAAAQYRVTRAGQRALRQAERPDPEEESAAEVLSSDHAIAPELAQPEHEERLTVEATAAA